MIEWFPLWLFIAFGAVFTYLYVTVEVPDKRLFGEEAGGSLGLVYAWLGWGSAALFAAFKLAGFLGR